MMFSVVYVFHANAEITMQSYKTDLKIHFHGIHLIELSKIKISALSFPMEHSQMVKKKQ